VLVDHDAAQPLAEATDAPAPQTAIATTAAATTERSRRRLISTDATDGHASRITIDPTYQQP
jgi:hypothetical protein